jgi:uncharacterized MnhB-related membrane protein
MTETFKTLVNRTWPALVLFICCIIFITVAVLNLTSASLIGAIVVSILGICYAGIWTMRLSRDTEADTGAFASVYDGEQPYQGGS